MTIRYTTLYERMLEAKAAKRTAQYIHLTQGSSMTRRAFQIIRKYSDFKIPRFYHRDKLFSRAYTIAKKRGL